MNASMSSGRVERVAVVSLHTCPLDQPGVGDSGGMNVAVRSLATRLAEAGVGVDVFTRRTSPLDAPVVDADPGVRVVHLDAGPASPVAKEDLPTFLWPFVCEMLRFESLERERLGYERPVYDVIHSHYWLSGWAARLLRERVTIPMAHSFHTLGAVKNRARTPGEAPEPKIRLRGEERIVASADLLVAPTRDEADDLVALYGACPDRLRIVPPGVDTDRFRRGDPDAARAALGLSGKHVVLFVGRLQPLKRPELAVHAIASIAARRPDLRERLALVFVGGPSGSSGVTPASLQSLAASLGIGDLVDVREPVPHPMLPDLYRAASVVVMPSTTESFGLVALEAQACGTPVVAADVGGLRTAVRDGVTGVLVSGDDPNAYGAIIETLLDDPATRHRMGAAGARHARAFDWRRSAASLIDAYGDVLRPAGAAAFVR